MRIPDRFWWLQPLVGILLVVASVVLFISRISNFSDVCVGVLFAVPGVSWIWTTRAAHNRFQRRLAAIHGQQDAMPRAGITVDPSGAASALTAPIHLTWQATALSRRLWTALVVILDVMFAAVAVLGGFLLYIAIATKITALKPIYPITPVELLIISAMGVCLVVGSIVAIVVFAIHLREHGRPYGVTASEEGVTTRPKAGRGRFIRWEDMRLLEVADSSFSLYGRDATIQWYNAGPNSMVETGTTDEEFSARHQMLLSVIAARTGLVPRTFTKSLQRGPADMSERIPWGAEEAEEVEDARS